MFCGLLQSTGPVGLPKKVSAKSIYVHLPRQGQEFCKKHKFLPMLFLREWDSRYFWFFNWCILLNYIIYRIQMTKKKHQLVIYPDLCISSSKYGKRYPRTHHAEVAGSWVPPCSSSTSQPCWIMGSSQSSLGYWFTLRNGILFLCWNNLLLLLLNGFDFKWSPLDFSSQWQMPRLP